MIINRVVVTRMFLKASGGSVVASEKANAPRRPPYDIMNCSVHVIGRTRHRFSIAVNEYITARISRST